MSRYREEVADHERTYCPSYRLLISQEPMGELQSLTAILNASEFASARYSGFGIISKTKVSSNLTMSLILSRENQKRTDVAEKSPVLRHIICKASRRHTLFGRGVDEV